MTPHPRDKFGGGGEGGGCILELLCLCVYLSVWKCVRILSGWYLLNCSTFCNQTWYVGMLSWDGVSCRNIVCYLQGHGHSKTLYNQNMTLFYYIFYAFGLFATELCFRVNHQNLECHVKNWTAVYRSRSQWRFEIKCWWILSGQYLLNRSTFCNQTWYGSALSWNRVSCRTFFCYL